jgi:hypothetical protein
MYPTNKEGDKIKQYQGKVAQQHKQYKVIKDEKYYNKEVDNAQQRLYKQYAAEDIKSNAAERHKKAEIIFADNKNYFIEYGITKDGKIIKEGFTDSFKADEKATDEHFKTSTYDRKRERLGHYSKAGYKVVITKKELKPQYKKEITKLLGKKVK